MIQLASYCSRKKSCTVLRVLVSVLIAFCVCNTALPYCLAVFQLVLPESVSNSEIELWLKNVSQNGSNGKRYFAVFSCSTPNNFSHRGFDYAFYLPLTVVAWKRVGFESIILIVGERHEWENHPVLSYILKRFDDLNRMSLGATVVFVSAEESNRPMLSQTARIFVANMAAYPGQPTDHIMTTDADLWPLRREHFYQPPGMDRPLTLVHSDCCDSFKFEGQSYRMLPMSHVGASAHTWRQMINVYPSFVANDSVSILSYFQNVFGPRVYRAVKFASDDWYLDQKLISIRVDEWIKLQESSENTTYELLDDGFDRIDRDDWRPHKIPSNLFPLFYDVHLPLNGYLPEKWKSIQIIVNYMYNGNSWAINWFNQYWHGFCTVYSISGGGGGGIYTL